MEIINGKYPVIGTNPQEYVPHDVLIPHEGQALYNHSQTLKRLAERGGLSWYEILCILEDTMNIDGMDIRHIDDNECKRKVWNHILKFYNCQSLKGKKKA